MENEKIILEREYVVPLRKGWIKKPYYKRVPAAIKTLKKFIARHMKIYDRDLKKIKIDKWLNVEMWFRGIRKPPAKIRVKAKKFESGIVKVELAEIPEKLKYKIKKEEEAKEKAKKIKEEKKKEKEEESKEEVKKEEEKIKKEAEEEEKLEEAEIKHREAKHITETTKKVRPIQRKALKK